MLILVIKMFCIFEIGHIFGILSCMLSDMILRRANEVRHKRLYLKLKTKELIRQDRASV